MDLHGKLSSLGVILFYLGIFAPVDIRFRLAVLFASSGVWYVAYSPRLKSNRFVPIQSVEFDSLADRMGVGQVLAKDRGKRYFKVARNLDAGATRSKTIIFGEQVYDSLTNNQRLAIVAHEFVHIREKDSRRWIRRYLVPSICLWGILFAGSLAIFRFPGVIGIFLFIGLPLAYSTVPFFLQVLDAKHSREVENRCDRVAASYVERSDLISALKKADSIVTPVAKKNPLYRLGVRTHPTVAEREILISSNS